MTQRSSVPGETFDNQALRVLVLYQGIKASAYAHDVISYLSKFKEIEAVSPNTSSNISEDIVSWINRCIDNSDASIVIVAHDPRPASSRGNMWFEIGMWIGKKGRTDNLLLLAAELSDEVGKAPSDLRGRAIMRFKEKEDLFQAINVFMHNQLQRKREKENGVELETIQQWDSPTQVTPVFISYSRNDSDFVDLLGLGLEKAGISYWRDIHDAPADPLDEIIDDAMRRNPAVILVLSRNSVDSDWVEDEATRARNLEKELNRNVLCPIALDDSWKNCTWSKSLRIQIQKYNILPFHDWRNDEVISSMMKRLINGLSIWY